MKRGVLGVLLALAMLFVLPAGASAITQTFSGTPVEVNDGSNGNPYPGTAPVSGVVGTTTKVTATLRVNTWGPQDLDALLVGPDGQKVMLLSDTCMTAVIDQTLTFDDSAAIEPTTTTLCNTGSYKPSDLDGGDTAMEMPPPAGTGPFSAQMAAFNTGLTNGTWSLYTRDDTVNGNFAMVLSWSLSITSSPAAQATAALPASAACPKGKKLKKVKGKRKCVRKKRKRHK